MKGWWPKKSMYLTTNWHCLVHKSLRPRFIMRNQGVSHFLSMQIIFPLRNRSRFSILARALERMFRKTVLDCSVQVSQLQPQWSDSQAAGRGNHDQTATVRGHLRQPTFPTEYRNHNPPNIFHPNNSPYIPPHRRESCIPWTPTSPLKSPSAPPQSHPSEPCQIHTRTPR